MEHGSVEASLRSRMEHGNVEASLEMHKGSAPIKPTHSCILHRARAHAAIVLRLEDY